MDESNCPVTYDSKSRIWRNLTPINEEAKKSSLGEIILKQLSAFDSEKIIEINLDTGIKTTASEMKRLTINFALNLQKLGVQKGDVVTLFCSMNSFTTPLIYACLVIGAVFVPLETLYSDDIVQYIFELVDPVIIAYDLIHQERLKNVINNTKLSALKYFLSFESRKDGNSIHEKLFEVKNSTSTIEKFQPPHIGDPEKILGAFVLTSGTTGRPKLMSHYHTYLGFGAVNYWDLNESNTIYIASPLRWISQISSILQPILQHCSRVYATLPPTPQSCAENIKKYNVTHFFSVATFTNQLLNYVYKTQGNQLISLEGILSGGERISSKILNMVENLNPNCRVILCYGMTELAGCAANNLETNLKDGYYILPGIDCKIIDENRKSLMPNQNGIICLRGKVKFGGYWKNDAANQSTFTEDGWLITGDYGKIDESNHLYVYNRYIDLIKSDGKFIIPTLLESALDIYPLLDASYVVGVPHQDSSIGETPIAFCKLNQQNFKKSNFSLDQAKEDIMKFLNFHLPKDQIPPSQIFFKDEFPYTTCGKVDKLNLRNLAINFLYSK